MADPVRAKFFYSVTGCALLLLAAAVSMAQQGTAPQDLETTRQSDRQHFVVSFRSQLEPLVINKIHQWTIHVATVDGKPVPDAQISVVGGMPLHDHGLPTLPRATQELGAGNYLVEGMKFHMSGWWQVTVTISAQDVQDAVTFDLVL